MKKFEISDMLCPVCKHTFPIPRNKNARRPRGHIKDLYCPFCKDVRKMIEYQPSQAKFTMSGSRIA